MPKYYRILRTLDKRFALDGACNWRYSEPMNRLFLLLLFLTAGFLGADPATVQIKEASLYAKASPVSKFLGKLPLGTVLTVLSEKDGWANVRAAGLSGWVRTQSYTTKPLNLKASDSTGSGVSTTEVSLAGRGFTEEIESDYKKKNPGLDFSELDRMEASGIDDGRLVEFLRDGGVKPRGGL